MNCVLMSGCLTKDCETRYSSNENNTAVSRFTLAVKRKFPREGEPDADFFNCVIFGKSAEFADKYYKKGTKLNVRGRLRNGSYINKEGRKIYYAELVVEESEFAEKKAIEKPASTSDHTSGSDTSSEGFMNIPDGIDEEFPFN